jgi:23S rRNA pseudouridine1911/1915/1917 synthase
MPDEPVTRVVSSEDAGQRLDVFLAQQFPEFSRVHVRRVISTGGALVDNQRTKVAYRLTEGQCVSFQPPELPVEVPQPENIPLDVLYEDQWMVAINKPAGMVVHPSKGHWSGTLTAALVYHFESLSSAGGPTRPGIVHRLDRETSGVIAIAKSNQVHLALAKQFEERSTEKEYFAIVVGQPEDDRGRIEQPIGVHPYHREKMAIRDQHATSRPASTFYEVTARLGRFATLRLLPRTGRTHQIRVHLAHLGCPVLCDRLYGGRSQITHGELLDQDDDIIVLSRQALHARRLEITHPQTGHRIFFEAPLPEDLKSVLACISERH